MDELQILTLLQIRGIGRKSVKWVLDTQPPSGLNDNKQLLSLLRKTKANHPRLSVPTQTELDSAYDKGQKILDRCRSLNIDLIGWNNSLYPQRLKSIGDPPVLLYAKGNMERLDARLAIAVIGTRNPSNYGRQVAERFGQVFAEQQAVVVSGLALGCDTAAHRGCLGRGGYTIAALAHGLDSVYPKSNSDLAKQILDESGILVSEYAPGISPRRSYFVDRDRLQSGLSDAVVVVETDEDGGSMHTARFCLEQGRVLAVFSHPAKRRYANTRGNELLIIEKNAIPLRDIHDIGKFLDRLEGPRRAAGQSNRFQPLQNLESEGQLTLF